MVTATAQLSKFGTDHRVVLSGISWERYEQLVDELERAGRRLTLTYDRGELEVEMPSEIHELIKKFISELLVCYFLSTDRQYLPLGQTTYKRRLLEKGLEPDESYYISNIKRVKQTGGNDLERVPPPDLAIEVEVTLPLLDKLPVYAAIGIRELWHISNSGQVRILLLKEDQYLEAPASHELPYFSAAMLSEWVSKRLDGEHLAVLQDFRHSLAAARPA